MCSFTCILPLNLLWYLWSVSLLTYFFNFHASTSLYIPNNIPFLLEIGKPNRKPLTEDIVLLLCIQIFPLLCNVECLCPVLVYSPWLLTKSDSGMVILETDISLLICLALSLGAVHVCAWRSFSVFLALEAEDNVQPIVIASCSSAQHLLLKDWGVGSPPSCNLAAHRGRRWSCVKKHCNVCMLKLPCKWLL